MDATREEALATLLAHPEHERALPCLRGWIESGDPQLIRAALGRLAYAPPAPRSPPPAAWRPPSAEEGARRAWVEGCPLRAPTEGCGCYGFCELGRRKVRVADCIRCFEGQL